MGLIELLEAGEVDAFNDQRGERSRPDLFAADLPGKQLVGVDLSNANLDKSDLTGSDLSHARLYRASLSGIDGSGLVLRAAVAVKARFKEAWLDGAVLDEADLSKADLSEAHLEGSRGEGLRLAGARLREAAASEVHWPGVDLTEASLHKADLSGSDLRNAVINDIAAVEAVFDGAHLDGVTGVNAKLPGASLKGVSLAGARLPEAQLARADLSGADLSHADLSRADLTGAVLTGACLRGAILADACLDEVDLTGLDLSGVDLSGVDPGGLGLSEAQRAQVAAVGVQIDPDAPLVFEDPTAARQGDFTAVVWDNPEGPESSSIRYAVLGGPEPVHGVVPVPAAAVLARAVVAHGDGFAIVVLRERTGGPVALVLELSRDGVLGRSTTATLGYEPAVRPVFSSADGVLRMWGLARRGPTLVVHELRENGLEPVHSEPCPTALHFLGRHAPVLACKGGVLVPVTSRGASRPLGTPEAFPGIVGLAVPFEESVWALWVQKKGERSTGGLRSALLAARRTADVQVLGESAGITAIDAAPDGDGVLVAWVEAGEDGLGPSRVFRARLPDGRPEVVAETVSDVDELCIAPGPGGPRIVLTTLADTLVLLDPSGAPEGMIPS